MVPGVLWPSKSSFGSGSLCEIGLLETRTRGHAFVVMLAYTALISKASTTPRAKPGTQLKNLGSRAAKLQSAVAAR
jgi:hypothetical protein